VGDAVNAVPAVAADAAVWAAWGTAVGYAAARAADARFAHDTWLTRIRSWERDGLTWERLEVRRWKAAVPELGALFGGRSKRRLPSGDRDGLARYALETRRAEIVHWVVPLAVVVMPIWSPAWVTAMMAAYAVAANAPCIVIQRYNRARACRLLDGRTATRRTP
jgi:glycosyl-4,4'-diaponeurosporenoate acyltransferase